MIALPLPLDWPARVCGKRFGHTTWGDAGFVLVCTLDAGHADPCWPEWIEAVP